MAATIRSLGVGSKLQLPDPSAKSSYVASPRWVGSPAHSMAPPLPAFEPPLPALEPPLPAFEPPLPEPAPEPAPPPEPAAAAPAAPPAFPPDWPSDPQAIWNTSKTSGEKRKAVTQDNNGPPRKTVQVSP